MELLIVSICTLIVFVVFLACKYLVPLSKQTQSPTAFQIPGIMLGFGFQSSEHYVNAQWLATFGFFSQLALELENLATVANVYCATWCTRFIHHGFNRVTGANSWVLQNMASEFLDSDQLSHTFWKTCGQSVSSRFAPLCRGYTGVLSKSPYIASPR